MVKLRMIKLSGATLIEVLIALMIIMVVFVMSIRLFTQVFSSGVSNTKASVHYRLKELQATVMRNGKVDEPKVRYIDSVSYYLESSTKAGSDLMVLSIVALQGNRVLDSLNCYYRPHGNP